MNDGPNKLDLKQIIKNLAAKSSSLWVVIILAGIGLLLLFSGSGDHQRDKLIGVPSNPQTNVNLETRSASDETTKEIYETEQRLERELERVLRNIAGAGEVRVDVNLKSGNRYIWERQSRSNKRVAQQQNEINTEESSSDELVFAKSRDGKDSPVLREELAPEVEGVVVVATGARDPRIKQRLTQTVVTSLNLPMHRVLVLAGEIRKEE